MRICFVSTTRGSYFMTELLEALAAASEAAGHDVELAFDEFPPLEDDRVYVAVPHEFEAWGRSGSPDAGQRARTIALCTENPGTEWFEATYRLLAGFGAAVSINRSSAAELRRRGVRCEHLQLGYSASWDRWHGEERVERPIDVLYLGAADPRRDPLLAGVGASLWARDCQFLVPPLEPRTAPRPDFLKEQDKYERLGRAKVLLNLHRTTSTAFEWMRFLEAICNGCVVVSEPSLDGEPLVAGEHYLQAPVERIADVAGGLLDDPPRLRALRAQAYEFVRERLPIEPAGERLAELADELLRGAPTTVAAAPTREPEPTPPRAAGGARSLDVSAVLAQARGAPSIAGRLGALRARAGGARSETRSYAAAAPRVSVLGVIADDAARESVELLESVAASRGGELEIVMLLDRPGGRGERAARRFLAERANVAAKLLGAEPSGLAAARNLLAESARGELLLTLPTRGGVFPTTVRRLADALERDRLALFAFAMIAVVEDGAPVELRGSMPWEAQRLTRENWIDSPALIRRERLLELGGYATDANLRGLEEYDLWCRCAEGSGHAVHVPQVLAWHPPQDDSQPRDFAALAPASQALIRERCPRLFAERPDA